MKAAIVSTVPTCSGHVTTKKTAFLSSFQTTNNVSTNTINNCISAEC